MRNYLGDRADIVTIFLTLQAPISQFSNTLKQFADELLKCVWPFCGPIPQMLKGLKYNMAETATRGVLLKKVFLEISQNSQENSCARVYFFDSF